MLLAGSSQDRLTRSATYCRRSSCIGGSELAGGRSRERLGLPAVVTLGIIGKLDTFRDRLAHKRYSSDAIYPGGNRAAPNC